MRTCKRADLRFAGESGKVRCVDRGHREVVRSYFGDIDICGRTELTTAHTAEKKFLWAFATLESRALAQRARPGQMRERPRAPPVDGEAAPWRVASRAASHSRRSREALPLADPPHRQAGSLLALLRR